MGENGRVEISAKTEYAVRAMLQLADAEQGTLVTTEALAGAQALPRKFLESILGELRRGGLHGARQLVGEHLSWVTGSHLYPFERPEHTSEEVLRWLAHFEALRAP